MVVAFAGLVIKFFYALADLVTAKNQFMIGRDLLNVIETNTAVIEAPQIPG